MFFIQTNIDQNSLIFLNLKDMFKIKKKNSKYVSFTLNISNINQFQDNIANLINL